MIKKTCKSMVAMLLVSLLALQAVPISAHAIEGSSTVVEVTKQAPLRTKASKHGDVVQTYSVGDCLWVVDSKVNASGNLWFKVTGLYSGWIFAGNVKTHEHVLCSVDNSDLQICKCGYYRIKASGLTRTDTLVSAGQLITPEILARLAAMMAAIAKNAAPAAAGGASAAAGAISGGWVVAIVVGGVVLFVSINATATKADVSSVRKSMEQFDPNRAENGKFYYSMVMDNLLWISYTNPISLENANRYLLMVATQNALLKNVDFRSVYTPMRADAVKLAKRFSRNILSGTVFGYGNTYGEKTHEIDFGKNGNPLEDHFEHFHLFCGSSIQVGTKIKNAHIFYGSPYCAAKIA